MSNARIDRFQRFFPHFARPSARTTKLSHDTKPRGQTANAALSEDCHARTPRGRKPKAPPATDPIDNVGTTELEAPVFSQPAPTPDPVQFEVKHPSDNPIYKQIDALNREHKLTTIPFPQPRDLPEPKLSLAAVLNIPQADLDNQIKKNGQLVFHSTGDTGNTRTMWRTGRYSSSTSAMSSTVSARANIITTVL